MVERKNHTLEEMTRIMLTAIGLAKHYWDEMDDTSSYVLNRCLMRAKLKKTHFELLRGRKPNI